jgi:uncharacterized protein (DUF1778 family)
MSQQGKTENKTTKRRVHHRGSTKKGERIDIRLSQGAKALLQRAAAERHKTLTEFLVDSGLSVAAETLADRRYFVLDDDQWEAFQAALDAPAKPRTRLKTLLNTPSALE